MPLVALILNEQHPCPWPTLTGTAGIVGRRIQRFKAHVSHDEIASTVQAHRDCLDEINTLEVDGKTKEADIVRKSRLPHLLSRMRQASECKLPLWRGGELRDTLLGMRHCAAQTVVPASTIDLLRERRVEQERKALLARTRSQQIARMGSMMSSSNTADSREQTAATSAGIGSLPVSRVQSAISDQESGPGRIQS